MDKAIITTPRELVTYVVLAACAGALLATVLTAALYHDRVADTKAACTEKVETAFVKGQMTKLGATRVKCNAWELRAGRLVCFE